MRTCWVYLVTMCDRKAEVVGVIRGSVDHKYFENHPAVVLQTPDREEALLYSRALMERPTHA